MSAPLRRWRYGALAIFVAAFAALFALPMMSAHAGPMPTLTATPNPVLVPANQPAGTYDLTWTLGSFPAIDLWSQTNTGPEIGPFTQNANGTNQKSINAGDTVTWRAFAKGNHEKELAKVVVTSRHIDTSCKTVCIKGATAVPHGTFGQFHVVLTSPHIKKVDIEVHEPGQNPVSTKTIDPPATGDFTTILSGLQPNRDHGWTVTATDEVGNTQKVNGAFHTLHRKVTVNYNPIQVIDDSDDLSGGDLKFWFGFKNQMDTNSFGEVNVDSGHFTFPNHTSTRMDAPDTVSLVVVGQDNDCDVFDFCSLPFETPATGPVGHGSDSLSDWATASTNVGVAVDGPGEAFTVTKNLSTTSFELQFSVKATVTVSYV